jgi:gamma-glutamyl:cysteine ligase YbdK (ATP-grasp superfamily)
MARFGMVIDTRKCVGCMDCVVACQTENDVPLGHARDWIATELEAMAPLAAELGLTRWLAPLHDLLAGGNQAMRWLARHGQGESIGAIIGSEAVALERRERALDAWLATEAAQVPGGS